MSPVYRSLVVLVLAGTSLIAADVACGAEGAPAETINKAGRQRMLVERIVKTYAQIGLDITPDASRRELHDAVRIFEDQLRDARKTAGDALSRQTVARLEELWLPFRGVATGPVDRAAAGRLLAMGDELVGLAHALTAGLQDGYSVPAGRLVNIAGRQRMLSQRLAKYYLVRSWGIRSPVIEREIGSAHAEFDGALATLRSAPENTEEIRRELEAVVLQWEWFQNALRLEGAASYSLIVVNAAESILNSMELVTALYARLPAR